MSNNGSHSRGNTKNSSTKERKAGYGGEHMFGQCLSCGKFYLCNLCVFPQPKGLKCGKMRHIKSVYQTTVHFARIDNEPRSSFSIYFGCT